MVKAHLCPIFMQICAIDSMRTIPRMVPIAQYDDAIHFHKTFTAGFAVRGGWRNYSLIHEDNNKFNQSNFSRCPWRAIIQMRLELAIDFGSDDSWQWNEEANSSWLQQTNPSSRLYKLPYCQHVNPIFKEKQKLFESQCWMILTKMTWFPRCEEAICDLLIQQEGVQWVLLWWFHFDLFCPLFAHSNTFQPPQDSLRARAPGWDEHTWIRFAIDSVTLAWIMNWWTWDLGQRPGYLEHLKISEVNMRAC